MSQNIDLGLIRKQQEDDLKKFQLESRRATQQQQAQDMSVMQGRLDTLEAKEAALETAEKSGSASAWTCAAGFSRGL